MRVVPILRLLAIAGIFQTLAYVGYWVYLSRNLTGDLLRFTLVSAVVRVACDRHRQPLGRGRGRSGVRDRAHAHVAAVAVVAVPAHGRPDPGADRRRAAHADCTAAAAVPTATVVWALGGAPAAVTLAAATACTVGVYALAGLLVPAVREDLRGVLESSGWARDGGPLPEQLAVVTRSA